MAIYGADIKMFVKSCPACQRVKINKHEHVKPGSFLSKKTRFKAVHIDIISPLPVIDWDSCYPIAVLLWLTGTAEVWKAFEDHWIKTFGIPTLLFSYGIVEGWHWTLKNVISCDCQNIKEWSSRLPMILLGLRVQPHLDSSLKPHQHAFGIELILPADFATREAEELEGADLNQQLQKVRDGYA